MKPIIVSQSAPTLESSRPLYERVPTRDEHGQRLSDFMVLFPGLRNRPAHQLAEILGRIQAVLGRYAEVVFAELNMRLNLLWISVRPRPGVILEIAAAIKAMMPEALLVGERCWS
ncbi:MAG: hypothetical protein M0Z84_02165 [Gammaproteobacteria bacterium]|nr:hypothetical protein [Gammaproteobacteria bacterium]